MASAARCQWGFEHPYAVDECEWRRALEIQYSRSTGTPLDKAMSTFWKFASLLVPVNVTPNSLTFCGFTFVFIPFCLILMLCPTWMEKPVPIVYFLVALGAFLQQTLDAIDGLHARRTGQTSPFGRFLDHSLDAISVGMLSYMAPSLSGKGIHIINVTTIIILYILTLFLSLSENATQKHRFSWGCFGVTEGQCAFIIHVLSITTGFFDFLDLRCAHLLEIVTNYSSIPIIRCIPLIRPFTSSALLFNTAFVVNSLNVVLELWSLLRLSVSWFVKCAHLGVVGLHLLACLTLTQSELFTVYPRLTLCLVIAGSSNKAIKILTMTSLGRRTTGLYWTDLPFYIFALYVSLSMPHFMAMAYVFVNAVVVLTVLDIVIHFTFVAHNFRKMIDAPLLKGREKVS